MVANFDFILTIFFLYITYFDPFLQYVKTAGGKHLNMDFLTIWLTFEYF